MTLLLFQVAPLAVDATKSYFRMVWYRHV